MYVISRVDCLLWDFVKVWRHSWAKCSKLAPSQKFSMHDLLCLLHNHTPVPQIFSYTIEPSLTRSTHSFSHQSLELSFSHLIYSCHVVMPSHRALFIYFTFSNQDFNSSIPRSITSLYSFRLWIHTIFILFLFPTLAWPHKHTCCTALLTSISFKLSPHWLSFPLHPQLFIVARSYIYPSLSLWSNDLLLFTLIFILSTTIRRLS